MSVKSSAAVNPTELYASAHLKVFVLAEPIFNVTSDEGHKQVPLQIYVQSLSKDFTVTYDSFKIKVEIKGIQPESFSFSDSITQSSTETTIPKGTASADPPAWGNNAHVVKDVKIRRSGEQGQKDARLEFQVKGAGSYVLVPTPLPASNGDPVSNVIAVVSQTR